MTAAKRFIKGISRKKKCKDKERINNVKKMVKENRQERKLGNEWKKRITLKLKDKVEWKKGKEKRIKKKIRIGSKYEWENMKRNKDHYDEYIRQPSKTDRRWSISWWISTTNWRRLISRYQEQAISSSPPHLAAVSPLTCQCQTQISIGDVEL